MPDVKHFDPDVALESAVRLFWRQGMASTGIQDIVTATGVNRSSLYATFGGKRELYLAALRRYLERYARPAFGRLATDERGLPAVVDFFDGLIDVRCSGERAGWGCLLSNAHAGTENSDPGVRALLDQNHRHLRDALHARLVTAGTRGELAPGTDPGATAELLALLAYGVNLRSRAGADAEELRATVATALRAIGRP
ncbi:TetR/AcrR family transcriptional regulator [Streptomyces luomodiensis]|uniref:TetR/AcrR family transcriptional regulator n=1 Tax=Streptomyces luomodiensis TaxID=3026192 RepID=A0ABY9V2N2_9ACTN|nr:TetR/AcrR family transcriptional regulator [Streptomyces sp. SCA4-21]WNE96294.1 TetR/AcrR family transcriptional regulator [Streptomyces sp. SCA4-21]